MAKLYKELSSCKPSAASDAYILNILPLFNESLAVLSSADEMLIINARTLDSTQVSRIADPGKGLACTAVDETTRLIFCGGTDSLVSVFDIRSGRRAATLTVGKSVTALACRGNDVAVGTELKQHQADLTVCATPGATPGATLGATLGNLAMQPLTPFWSMTEKVQVAHSHTPPHPPSLAIEGSVDGSFMFDLFGRDVRQQKIRWQNNENNDDITALDFHPRNSHILLSGGDDGLVGLFDTTVQEEDDSLVQAFNHGPIHKAGFIDQSAVYALSSDQNLAMHPVFEAQRETEPGPVLLGDMRPLVPCEYVIDLLHAGDEFIVATGSHSKSQVNLVNMKGGFEPDVQNMAVLQNAHGNEIVRTIFIDTANSCTIFTGAEDGHVKAWHPADILPHQDLGCLDTGSEKKPQAAKHSRPRKRSSIDARYKPY
ncbi:hypothetical protein DV737_g4631, partial [Chaetothyriales sp. CBS 132003]